MSLLDRIRAVLGRPSDAYVEQAAVDVLHDALRHPGKVRTRHVGFGHTVSAVVPRPDIPHPRRRSA